MLYNIKRGKTLFREDGECKETGNGQRPTIEARRPGNQGCAQHDILGGQHALVYFKRSDLIPNTCR